MVIPICLWHYPTQVKDLNSHHFFTRSHEATKEEMGDETASIAYL